MLHLHLNDTSRYPASEDGLIECLGRIKMHRQLNDQGILMTNWRIVSINLKTIEDSAGGGEGYDIVLLQFGPDVISETGTLKATYTFPSITDLLSRFKQVSVPYTPDLRIGPGLFRFVFRQGREPTYHAESFAGLAQCMNALYNERILDTDLPDPDGPRMTRCKGASITLVRPKDQHAYVLFALHADCGAWDAHGFMKPAFVVPDAKDLWRQHLVKAPITHDPIPMICPATPLTSISITPENEPIACRW